MKPIIIILLPLLLVFSQSCSSQISLFNERAYEQAVNLKVEALYLVDRADKPYAEHEQEILELRLNLQKALEFARGRPDNEISIRQWEILIDPNRNLLGGFLARWEANGKLSPVFIMEFRSIISDSFDDIIGLESGKIKPENL